MNSERFKNSRPEVNPLNQYNASLYEQANAKFNIRVDEQLDRSIQIFQMNFALLDARQHAQ